MAGLHLNSYIIRIEVQAHDEKGCIITISDNGIGMTSTELNQAFDPFFTTKEVGEGMGLGLSIVHAIVKDCNGQIFLHSIPNEGSTVEMWFPISEK